MGMGSERWSATRVQKASLLSRGGGVGPCALRLVRSHWRSPTASTRPPTLRGTNDGHGGVDGRDEGLAGSGWQRLGQVGARRDTPPTYL